MSPFLAAVSLLGSGIADFDDSRLLNRSYLVDGRGRSGPKPPTLHESTYRRKSDPSRVSIAVSAITNNLLAEIRKNPFPLAQGVVDPNPNGAFSGHPAGEYVRHLAGSDEAGSSGLSVIVIGTARYRLDATLSYFGKGKPGNITWSGSDRVKDREAVDGTLRTTLARLQGDELSGAGNVTLNGRSMSKLRDDRGNEYVPLADWCAARGSSLTTNSTRCTATFTRSGKAVIVPLSANQIKVGSKWEKLLGFIVEVDGKWYVPLQDLEDI